MPNRAKVNQAGSNPLVHRMFTKEIFQDASRWGFFALGVLLGMYSLHRVNAEGLESRKAKTIFNDAESLPPTSSDLILGRFVYRRNCQICHGSRGDGKGEWSEGLSPKPRSFRDAHFKYRSTPTGKLPTDADLARTIRGGRSNTAMGMFTRLSDRELKGVIAYLKSFSTKWKDSSFHGEKMSLPPKPSGFDDPVKRETIAARGQELFEISCAPCHGSKADGQGPQADALIDVRGRPMPPANLLAPHLRSGNRAEDLLRVLMTGLDGTPMASFADSLKGDEMWAIAAFVETLRGSSEK